MNLVVLQQLLEGKMLDVLVVLEQKLRRSLPIPKLELKQIGRCAGRANSNTNTIQINPDYYVNGYQDEILNVTVPHEVAHIVADFIYVNDYRNKNILVNHQPHGHLWKYVMSLLGLPPVRCHDMKVDGVENVRPRPFKYVCGCSEHMIGAIKHGRAQRGEYSSFRCRNCKGNLRFIGRI